MHHFRLKDVVVFTPDRAAMLGYDSNPISSSNNSSSRLSRTSSTFTVRGICDLEVMATLSPLLLNCSSAASKVSGLLLQAARIAFAPLCAISMVCIVSTRSFRLSAIQTTFNCPYLCYLFSIIEQQRISSPMSPAIHSVPVIRHHRMDSKNDLSLSFASRLMPLNCTRSSWTWQVYTVNEVWKGFYALLIRVLAGYFHRVTVWHHAKVSIRENIVNGETCGCRVSFVQLTAYLGHKSGLPQRWRLVDSSSNSRHPNRLCGKKSALQIRMSYPFRNHHGPDNMTALRHVGGNMDLNTLDESSTQWPCMASGIFLHTSCKPNILLAVGCFLTHTRDIFKSILTQCDCNWILRVVLGEGRPQSQAWHLQLFFATCRCKVLREVGLMLLYLWQVLISSETIQISIAGFIKEDLLQWSHWELYNWIKYYQFCYYYLAIDTPIYLFGLMLKSASCKCKVSGSVIIWKSLCSV